MKKLIEAIARILFSFWSEQKAVEPVQYKIYMPGEKIPYDESTIEDVECEIVK